MINSELLRLLKYGQQDEIRARIGAEQKKEYANSFPMFMDEMLSEYKVKRKDIAVRSGLSQDYLYKLLRGDKKTTERDYILAICISIGMNLAQIQHALKIYGMPMLSDRDLRSHVIMVGIEDGRDIYDIDSFLEKAGFPYLKVSPDMPSAEIKSIGEEETVPVVQHEYTEIRRFADAIYRGPAPMDYDYIGMIVFADEKEDVFTSVACFSMDTSIYFTVKGTVEVDEDGELLLDKLDADCALEEYVNLLDTMDSEFCRFYIDLDKMTDEKVSEVLKDVNDTKNYGMHIGCRFGGGEGNMAYLEAYNTGNPGLHEYYQIVRNNDSFRYSVSHESVFMRLELGEDIYPVYFGEYKDPEYVVESDSIPELGLKNVKYKFIFTDLQQMFNGYVKNELHGLFDNKSDRDDKTAYLAQKATIALHSHDIESAIQFSKELLDLYNEDALYKQSHLDSVIITMWKIGYCYALLNDWNQSDEWLRLIVNERHTLEELINNGTIDIDSSDVNVSVGDACRRVAIEERNAGHLEEAKALLLDSIHWYEMCDIEAHSAQDYVDSLASYALAIDGEEPELALTYTEKALKFAQRYHFENDESGMQLLNTVLNNHAWVLWNRCGMEEAIIYYGRAIDYLEAFLEQNSNDFFIGKLAHEANALYKIYDATSKIKERDRLVNRMAKWDIQLPLMNE